MELSKTAICKLKPSTEDSEKLFNTLTAFRNACNHISQIAFTQRIFNPVVLHHATYRETRQQFSLPANLAIRARDRVAKAYKLNKHQLLKFTQQSMDLDGRLFRLIYKPEGIYASIATLQKRVKVLLNIGEYQRKLLENAKPTYATLVYRNKQFYLHVIVKRNVADPKGVNPVGVDVGMSKLLVASNGFKVNGGETLRRKHGFRELRSILQSKGTKSSKRALQRLRGKEKRYVNNVLHEVSRQFVNTLKNDDVVVMEKLTNIRGRAKHRKSQNGDFHSWAFAKLQSMIRYKALERGIPVVEADPQYSSQTCPRCGTLSKANRKSQALFHCVNCGFQHNADYVASVNLSRVELARSRLAPVNEPIVGMNVFFNHYDSPTSPSASAVGS